MNNTITSFFFDLLAKHGIPHHQIKKLNDREALCKKVSIIPMEVVTRNIAAGSLAKKMGVEEGYVMKRPIVEFYYKNDDLGDPMIKLIMPKLLVWQPMHRLQKSKPAP